MKKLLSLIISVILCLLICIPSASAVIAQYTPDLLNVTPTYNQNSIVFTFEKLTIVTAVKISATTDTPFTVEYSDDDITWSTYTLFTQLVSGSTIIENPTANVTEVTYDTRSTHSVKTITINTGDLSASAITVSLIGYEPTLTADSKIVPFNLGTDDANVFHSEIYVKSETQTYNPAAVFNFTVGSGYSTDPTGGIFVSANSLKQFVGSMLSEDVMITDITFSARSDKATANSRFENHVFKASAVGDVNGDNVIDASDILQWTTIAEIDSGFSTASSLNNVVYSINVDDTNAYRYVAYFCADSAYIDISTFEVYGVEAELIPETTVIDETTAEPIDETTAPVVTTVPVVITTAPVVTTVPVDAQTSTSTKVTASTSDDSEGGCNSNSSSILISFVAMISGAAVFIFTKKR